MHVTNPAYLNREGPGSRHYVDLGDDGLREAGFLLCPDCTAPVRPEGLAFAATLRCLPAVELVIIVFCAFLAGVTDLTAPLAVLFAALLATLDGVVFFSLRARVGLSAASGSGWTWVMALSTACLNWSCSRFHHALGLPMAACRSGLGGNRGSASSLAAGGSGASGAGAGSGSGGCCASGALPGTSENRTESWARAQRPLRRRCRARP